jgi:hypothetical protein
MVDKYAVAPSILESYNKQVEAIKTGVEEIPSQLTQPDGSIVTTSNEMTHEIKQQIEDLKRAVLTFDGHVSGINAALDKLGDNYKGRFKELFKYAKQCSLDQQSADTGRGHSEIKGYLRQIFERDGDSDTVFISAIMKRFLDNFLSKVGFNKGSYETYRRFFIHLPECVAAACTVKKMRLGWEFAGTVNPPNHLVMFDRCSKWSNGDITEEQQQEILDAVSEGIEMATKGYLSDNEIHGLIGHIVDLDMTDYVKENGHTSHKRALWISNEKYRDLLISQMEEKKVEAERKASASQAKKQKKEEGKAEKEAKDIEKARRTAAGGKPARIMKAYCCNSLCGAMSHKDDLTYNTWHVCTRKKCKDIFCTKPACEEIFDGHIAMCKK